MPRRTASQLHHGPFALHLQTHEGRPEFETLVRLLSSNSPLVWLDSARAHPVTGRWSMVGADPWLMLSSRQGYVELRTTSATQCRRVNPLAALHEVLQRYKTPARSGPLARSLGLLGFLSYEMNRWIETLPAPRTSEPELPEMVWFGMKTIVLFDHWQQRSWLMSLEDPYDTPALARQRARERLEQVSTWVETPPEGELSTPRGSRALCSSLQATMTQQAFETMVAQALEHIRAGDLFQINLSQRFTTSWKAGSTLPLYLALRQVNPSPFACWLSWEDHAIMSCSPERLVRVQEGRIDTRPIAGTRARGATPSDDAINSLELLLSEKERAEHLMLVDLARNDLGRVCQMGTVQVNELMALEEYSHVMHIVSDVGGLLRHGVDTVEVIRAVFPGGTITGCPKVRCMQIIRELEPVPRGLYTGSVGLLGFDGTVDLNIAIRTMLLQGHQLSFYAGAGIVADSDPSREYDETLAKTQALTTALHRAQDVSHAANR